VLIKNFKITNKTPSKSNIKTIKATVEYLLKYIKKHIIMKENINNNPLNEKLTLK